MSLRGHQLLRMLNDQVNVSLRQEATTFLAGRSENRRVLFYAFRLSKLDRSFGFLTSACLYWRGSPNHDLSTRPFDGLISRDYPAAAST
jgi:hypothetical protein